VLVHQLLALTLQFGAISSERCWEPNRLSPTSGITQAEFEVLIKHMIQEDYLFMAGVFCRWGTSGQVFGANFMELYAVFSSPPLQSADWGGYIVGSLEQAFVDKLVSEMSSFLLEVEHGPSHTTTRSALLVCSNSTR